MSKASKLTLNRETLTRLSMNAVRAVPGGYDDTGSDLCSAQQCSQISCPPSYDTNCETLDALCRTTGTILPSRNGATECR